MRGKCRRRNLALPRHRRAKAGSGMRMQGETKAGSFCPILKAEKRRGGWFTAPRKADFRLLS
jgi:hypothetical protein